MAVPPLAVVGVAEAMVTASMGTPMASAEAAWIPDSKLERDDGAFSLLPPPPDGMVEPTYTMVEYVLGLQASADT